MHGRQIDSINRSVLANHTFNTRDSHVQGWRAYKEVYPGWFNVEDGSIAHLTIYPDPSVPISRRLPLVRRMNVSSADMIYIMRTGLAYRAMVKLTVTVR